MYREGDGTSGETRTGRRVQGQPGEGAKTRVAHLFVSGESGQGGGKAGGRERVRAARERRLWEEGKRAGVRPLPCLPWRCQAHGPSCSKSQSSPAFLPRGSGPLCRSSCPRVRVPCSLLRKQRLQHRARFEQDSRTIIDRFAVHTEASLLCSTGHLTDISTLHRTGPGINLPVLGGKRRRGFVASTVSGGLRRIESLSAYAPAETSAPQRKCSINSVYCPRTYVCP